MAQKKQSKNTAQNDINYVISFVKTLKLEGLVLAALMVVLTREAGQSLWFLPATFLLFDVSMIGYMFNEKVGAFTYNLVHNSVLPTLLLIAGILLSVRSMEIWAYAWLFHVGIDRALGYGLKHKTSFKHTHLGKL